MVILTDFPIKTSLKVTREFINTLWLSFYVTPLLDSLSFNISQKESFPIIKRYTGGKIHKEQNYPIITPSGLMHSNVAEDGWIEESYLIITRMPNLSNEMAWNQKKDLLIFSGTHGTGTRAIELLFKEKAVLKDILDEIGESKYFQSLLLVPEIIHDDKKHDSLPSNIKHLKSEPMVINDNRVNSWFRNVKDNHVY